MSAWSLGVLLQQDKVAALVDDNTAYSEAETAYPRDKSVALILAVLWLRGARSGTESAAYAWDKFCRVIGLETARKIVRHLEERG